MLPNAAAHRHRKAMPLYSCLSCYTLSFQYPGRISPLVLRSDLCENLFTRDELNHACLNLGNAPLCFLCPQSINLSLRLQV